MATWSELETAFPAARRWREDLRGMPVAHLATVDREGAPRIHPVCPHHAGEALYVVVGSRSPKRHDLAERGRYSLHSINVDDAGPDFDEFELTVSGRARRIERDDDATWRAVRTVCPYTFPDDDWLFELSIDRALTAVWDPIGTKGRRAYRLLWREGWPAPRPPSNEEPATLDDG